MRLQPTDEMTVGEVAERSGFSTSALRYYEEQGLVSADRTDGGQRRFRRSVLRRLAFIAAARHVGLSLEEIKEALDSLPERRNPTKADWTRISKKWRSRLDAEIEALEDLRDGLDRCIGCGCLSLQTCRISNRDDVMAARGAGARMLSGSLRPSD